MTQSYECGYSLVRYLEINTTVMGKRWTAGHCSLVCLLGLTGGGDENRRWLTSSRKYLIGPDPIALVAYSHACMGFVQLWLVMPWGLFILGYCSSAV